MRKYALLVLVAAAMFSCNSNQKPNDQQAEKTESTEMKDMHTAENSLDYWGVYEGTLPAADCPGIMTTLTINKDNTFTLHSVYIDRKDATFDEKGTYTVNGNILTTTEGDGSNFFYKIEEGQLRMLDGDKQPVTGDLAEHYVLKQTQAL